MCVSATNRHPARLRAYKCSQSRIMNPGIKFNGIMPVQWLQRRFVQQLTQRRGVSQRECPPGRAVGIQLGKANLAIALLPGVTLNLPLAFSAIRVASRQAGGRFFVPVKNVSSPAAPLAGDGPVRVAGWIDMSTCRRTLELPTQGCLRHSSSYLAKTSTSPKFALVTRTLVSTLARRSISAAEIVLKAKRP